MGTTMTMEVGMGTIDIKRFGFAWGVTAALLYLGCVFVMAILGKEGSIDFFNRLLHGIDVTTIIRMDMPVSEMFTGLVETFILAWLVGATIASLYNLTLRSPKNSRE